MRSLIMVTRNGRLIPSKTGNNHEDYKQQPACDVKGHRTGISAEGANDIPPVKNKAPIQAERIGDNKAYLITGANQTKTDDYNVKDHLPCRYDQRV
jgi:hypothetical protein